MHTKKEQKPDHSSSLGFLPTDAWVQITNNLPVRSARNLLLFTSKNNFDYFSPLLDQRLVFTWVLESNIDGLKVLLKRNSNVFFQKKSQIKSIDNTIYHDISAYQLMLMLCHLKMKKNIQKILNALPKAQKEIQQQQAIEMNSGGSDLIKINFNPLEKTKEGFERIKRTNETMFISFGNQYDLTFPLLENPDGILYYKDQNAVAHLYYANQTTQEIVEIKLKNNISIEEKQEFSKFKQSFRHMLKNSGRRSSDNEHELIETLLGYTLQRKGACYIKDGISYQDSFMQFRLINAYRKCIWLCQHRQWDRANTYWIETIGNAQREVIWILQKLCKKNFTISIDDKKNSIFCEGEINEKLGTEWSIINQSATFAVNDQHLSNEYSKKNLIGNMSFFSYKINKAKENTLNDSKTNTLSKYLSLSGFK